MATTYAPIDPNEVAAFHSMLTAQQPQAKVKGNFLTHLFPTIGGIAGGAGGGAAGGALAGTAVLPGIGTAVGGLLGALIGGAGGGALGKVAENKAEGQALGNGVGGQALEQGVLSAGPLRLLKVGGAATKAGVAAAKDGGGLLDALQAGSGAADVAASKPGLVSKLASGLTNKGQQLEARAGGYGVGEKASGGVQLGVQDSRTIGDFLKQQGIKAGSPETRLDQVEQKLNNVGQQIDTHINANNTTMAPAAAKKITGNFMKSVEKQAGNTPGVQKWAQNYADNFTKQVKDTKSLVDFRRQLDQQVINFNQNPQGSLVDKQLAARAFRSVLSKQTDKLAPGISDLNRTYSGLTDASEFLKGGAKAVSDQSQGGGGIVSRVLTNDTAQAAKSHLGSVLQTAGNAAPASSSVAALPLAARSLTGNALLGALQSSNSNASTTSPTTPKNPNTILANTMNDSSSNMPALSQTADGMSSTSPFDPSNIEANIAKIVAAGGTMDDVTKYVSLASAVSSLQQKASGSSSANMVKPTGQQYGLAQGGVNALQQMAQSIQQNPSVVEKNATPGQGLPVVGSYITNAVGAGDYHALADNVLQSLIHLQTGATATPEEVKAARGQLPQPGDSADVQQKKLSNLLSMFAPYIQGGQIGSNSLAAALGGA